MKAGDTIYIKEWNKKKPVKAVILEVMQDDQGISVSPVDSNAVYFIDSSLYGKLIKDKDWVNEDLEEEE